MESDSVNSSPVLRVTADISELKDSSECIKHTCSKTQIREIRNHLHPNGFNKKKLHPLQGSNPYQGRNNYCGSYVNIQNAKNNVSTFTQRIMSAKLLRVKQLQNQLAESQSRVNELLNENKLLKTLQRRQDSALKKYECNTEQLPQLIKSHNEEIRIINAKFKQLKLNYRVLENKLKERDTELTNLKEQHKHLLKLSRDKQLGDREKLTKKLEEMEAQVKLQQEKIHILTRKNDLEGKNYRHRLNLEVNRHKETQIELREARKTIETLKSSKEGKQPFVNLALSKRVVRPFTHSNQQSRISLPAPPPNVSIRQPQRLVHSETAIMRDEDSDSDSFSFGLQNMPQNTGDDSCSDRSDSNGRDEKSNHFEEHNHIESDCKKVSANPSHKQHFSTSGGSISSCNSQNNIVQSNTNLIGHKSVIHPKNVLRSTMKLGSSESKFLTRFDQQKFEQLDEHIRGKQLIEKKASYGTALRNVNRRNSINAVVTEVKNIEQLPQKRMQSIAGKKFEKSGSLDSLKSNIMEKDNSDESSKLMTNTTPSEEGFGAKPYVHELSTMEAEIEKELDGIMNKKSEENDNSLISKDHLANSMEAAIEELERKFKIFDMPQIRKEAEDDINRIVDRACMSLLEEELDIETQRITPDKFQLDKKVSKELEEDDFLRKLENCYKEVEDPKTDIVLGESQKADLLKALNNIDQESDSSNNMTNYFKDSNDQQFDNISFQKCQDYAHVGNFINSRGKSEVMKELFSEESATVSSK